MRMCIYAFVHVGLDTSEPHVAGRGAIGPICCSPLMPSGALPMGRGGKRRGAGALRKRLLSKRQLRVRCVALGIRVRGVSVDEMWMALNKYSPASLVDSWRRDDVREALLQSGVSPDCGKRRRVSELRALAASSIDFVKRSRRRFSLTMVEFFSGIGGAHLGGLKAGYFSRGAYDSNAEANATYALNHGVEPLNQDLSKKFRVRTADLAWASPPCPPWSSINRFGPWGLATPVGRLMLRLPYLFARSGVAVMVIEQVPGLLTVNGGRDWAVILKRLQKGGHTVTVKRINCGLYGIDQRRVRLFVVVARSGLNLDLSLLPRGRKHGLLLSGRLAAVGKCRTIRARGGRGSDSRAFRTVVLRDGTEYTLTIRDMLRMQGFPRSFRFPPTMLPRTRQMLISNAVPPPMVAAPLGVVRCSLMAAKYTPCRYR